MGAWVDSLSPEDRAKHEQEEKERFEWERHHRIEGAMEAIQVNVDRLRTFPPSREVSLAITKLEEGILWLMRENEK